MIENVRQNSWSNHNPSADFMTELDQLILETLGMNRYCSMGLFLRHFKAFSRFQLLRRIRLMMEEKLIGCRLGLEPMTKKVEYIYFLKKKGSELLMLHSEQFASVDEVDTPKGHFLMRHDLAVAWLRVFVERDGQEYLNSGWLNKLEYESRRSKIITALSGSKFFPDALLNIQRHNKSVAKFWLEVDNSTENRQQLKRKFLDYRSSLQNTNHKLLLIIVQHSEKRLALLLNIAGQIILDKSLIYACTIPEIDSFGIFSNIWTMSLDKSNDNERQRFHLPL